MIILIKWIKFQKILSKVINIYKDKINNINKINNKMSFKINKIIKWGIKIVLIIIFKQKEFKTIILYSDRFVLLYKYTIFLFYL